MSLHARVGAALTDGDNDAGEATASEALRYNCGLVSKQVTQLV